MKHNVGEISNNQKDWSQIKKKYIEDFQERYPNLNPSYIQNFVKSIFPKMIASLSSNFEENRLMVAHYRQRMNTHLKKRAFRLKVRNAVMQDLEKRALSKILERSLEESPREKKNTSSHVTGGFAKRPHFIQTYKGTLNDLETVQSLSEMVSSPYSAASTTAGSVENGSPSLVFSPLKNSCLSPRTSIILPHDQEQSCERSPEETLLSPNPPKIVYKKLSQTQQAYFYRNLLKDDSLEINREKDTQMSGPK